MKITSLRKLALALSLVLAGCGTPTSTTPAPPNSPQTTVALTVKTVADAALSCIDTVIQLRDTAKKITPAQATTIGNWCAFVATTDKQISAVLTKSEPWADQKREILVLLGTVTAPTIATNIDPGAQVLVAQIMTLINQIKAQVQL